MVRHSTDADLSERDAKLLKALEQWGWFVTKVSASDSDPAFAYSINFVHFASFDSYRCFRGQKSETVAG